MSENSQLLSGVSRVRISVPLKCFGMKAHQWKDVSQARGIPPSNSQYDCDCSACMFPPFLWAKSKPSPGLGDGGELCQALFWH